jgi:transcriptional regulator with XRE-family HTH domain
MHDLRRAVPREKSTSPSRWAVALRRLMQEKAITQTEIANRAAVDKNTVTNVLRGDSVNTATLERLAYALGVDVSELALTGDQSRVLAENRAGTTGDLAKATARELAALLTALWGQPPPTRRTPPLDTGSPTLTAAREERRSGADRRSDGDRRSGRDRRAA